MWLCSSSPEAESHTELQRHMIYRGDALRRKGVGWLRMGQGKELSWKVLSVGDELQPDPLGALEHDLCEAQDLAFFALISVHHWLQIWS